MRWRWPSDVAELEELQSQLARARPARWVLADGELIAGGCFVCFERGAFYADYDGESPEPGWAAASVATADAAPQVVVQRSVAAGPYIAGLLALREGPLLEAVVRALPHGPDVLLVNATGADHPRRAGLALHLGAVLDLPSVGVTHRPLHARGDWPEDRVGATSSLMLDGELVGAWLRTRLGHRPLAVNAGWRTDLDSAIDVVRRVGGPTRTPAPIRRARRAARQARAEEHRRR